MIQIGSSPGAKIQITPPVPARYAQWQEVAIAEGYKSLARFIFEVVNKFVTEYLDRKNNTPAALRKTIIEMRQEAAEEVRQEIKDFSLASESAIAIEKEPSADWMRKDSFEKAPSEEDIGALFREDENV